jgi:flagellar biogenesis protein FliO
MTPLSRYVLETVLTLGAVTGLAVVILYAARRVGIGKPSGPLSIAGRLVLDPRRAIYLVRVGDLVYVIGASEGGLSKLGELPPDKLEAFREAGAAPGFGFREVLGRVRGRENPGKTGPSEED